MLSQSQIDAYNRDGFIVVEGVLSKAEVQAMRDATDRIIEGARKVAQHTDVYDLEPSHTPERPRVRRIKSPHKVDPVFDRVMRHEKILAILRQLIGPAIRYDESKLNMKDPNYGSAVEWHQDWSFYPQTNPDLCAVGVMMDDCFLENGPLLLIPGSHKGPVYDHHVDGHFAGAMDPTKCDVDFSKAVPCVGPAGSISIHHAIAIHGSALNTSNRPRRLLLYQYAAADAWPLCAVQQPTDWEAWKARILCGEVNLQEPRFVPAPVRLPLPAAKRGGSIYETQSVMKNAYFDKAPTSAAAM